MSREPERHPPIETDQAESNPNASGPQGLRGEMGISSERTGPVAGEEGEGTDGAEPTVDVDAPETVNAATSKDTPPEQAAGGPEDNPDGVAHPHEFDAGRNPGHSGA